MTSTGDEPRLRQLLQELETWWRDLGAPIATALRDPVSEDAFPSTGLPFEIPVELRVWWTWHDGVEAAASRATIGPGNYRPLSLAESVEQYHRNRTLHPAEDAEANGVPEMYWHETWLPILVAGAERLYVDCSEQPRAASPIRLVTDDWEDAAVARTPSLADAVAMWVQALAEGFYRWSEEGGGRWSVDYPALPLEWRISGLF